MPESSSRPAVALVPAGRDDMPLVAAMARFYVYDVARAVAPDLDWPAGRDWLYDPVDWSIYWDTDNHPFLIEADGRLAGFCLVDHRPLVARFDWNMGQFFVLGPLVRRGIGREAARLAFRRFPGIWQVAQIPENRAAVAFWRKVVAEASGGRFEERLVPDPAEDGDLRNVLVFESRP